jgi:hypothetical protein
MKSRTEIKELGNLVWAVVLGVSLVLALSSCADKGSTEGEGDAGGASPVDETALMVPLPIVLPKAQFVGTPVNIAGVTNLEKVRGKARPPFLAPDGVTNVALGKTVTASIEEPIMGEFAMIVDGDKEAMDGSLVELDPFPQSVTIDLEAEYDIYAILFWHYHKQSRVYFDVVVQIADDPDFVENVRTIFNNDDDNTGGLGAGKDMHYVEVNEGKLLEVGGQKARYVRLYSQGNNSDDQNHYLEVEVYGKPAE